MDFVEEQLRSLHQGDRPLEDFVEDFLELCHHEYWNERTLNLHFWSELNDELLQIMLVGNNNCSLFEYIVYVAGSPLVFEEEARSEPSKFVPTQPAQNPPLDHSQPNPEPDPTLTTTTDMETEPTADRETQPLLATNIEPEPKPATEPEPAAKFVLEAKPG